MGTRPGTCNLSTVYTAGTITYYGLPMHSAFFIVSRSSPPTESVAEAMDAPGFLGNSGV